MANFKYRAYDESGAAVSGEIESDSTDSALEALRNEGLMPTSVKEVQASVNIPFLSSDKVKISELEFLTSELALLLRSGVRIDKGIDILQQNKGEGAGAKLLTELRKSIHAGKSLSESLAAFPDTFSPLYCNLVEIGESSGNLPIVFEELSDDLKFQNELRQKVVSALAYPAVIFAVCVLSILFIFNFVVPRMATMFDGVPDLPWYTSALISTSNWVSGNFMLLLLGIAGVSALARFALTHPVSKQKWQNFSLRLPVIRSATFMVERIRFCSGMSLMLRSGLAIDKALSLCLGNVKNPAIQRELEIASNKVNQGKQVSQAFGRSALFPSFYVSLLEVGESAGNLEVVFNEIMLRSRKEFETMMNRLTTLLEPLMIVLMGGIVGGVVVVMLLSMVSVNEFAF